MNWLLLTFSCRDNPVTKVHPGEGLLLARNLKLDLFWIFKCNPSIGEVTRKVKKCSVSLVLFFLKIFSLIQFSKYKLYCHTPISLQGFQDRQHSGVHLGPISQYTGSWWFKGKKWLYSSRCIIQWRHPPSSPSHPYGQQCTVFGSKYILNKS